MVFALKIDVSLSMSSVAVQSRDGGLVALGEVWVVVDIPKQRQCDLQELEEDSLLQLDLETSEVVSAAGSEELHAEADSEGASVVVSDKTFAEDEEVLDTKAGVALAEEVGIAVVLPTAMAMVRHHPQMLLRVLEEEEASVVGMVALPSTAA